MCGIAAIIPDQGAPQSCLDEKVRTALETISYRGPDGSGIFSDDGAVLGSVRLAVVDKDGGRQPMKDAQTGVVLVYNGMIYNYIEMREKLIALGHIFHTRCDTEVLLKGYVQYGSEVLEYLNGMFAFAIYDPRDRRLFCARDHLGIKPLYYRHDEEGLAIASEIKALIAMRGDPVLMDAQAVNDYVHLQYTLGDKTFFRGVKKLLPGNLMTYRDGDLHIRSYWEPIPTGAYKGNFRQAAVELRQLLEDSVRMQTRADVPLGSHLSGGLDTGSICSLANQYLGTKKIKTFTAAFREGGIFDDTESASISARHVGSDHHVAFPDAGDFAAQYENLIYHLDEPVAGPGVFPQYVISKMAKEHVTVVLGGQGADEIFGGYTRHYLMLLDQAVRNGAGLGKENVGISWAELGQSLGQMNRYGELWRKMQSGDPFADAASRYWSLIDRSDGIANHFSSDYLEGLHGYQTFNEFVSYLTQFRDAELLNRILYFETTNWLPALLQVEDRLSMACSLESRVPILDVRIVDLAFSLPTAIKMRNGQTKAVFREACRDLLAPAIRDRRDKVGFPVPMNRWLRGPLKEFMWDILGSEASRRRGIFSEDLLDNLADGSQSDMSRVLWGVLNIELWFKTFGR